MIMLLSSQLQNQLLGMEEAKRDLMLPSEVRETLMMLFSENLLSDLLICVLFLASVCCYVHHTQ